ncbi:hypothetical protein D6783_05060 [Candidatus Woesearchaeota archaeon]|nr:MAG: hypothetical protein D6783_05060 [Candidatus Woesearchaeota archaeon]
MRATTGKRGDMTAFKFLTLFELLFGGFVLILVITIVLKSADASNYWQRYYAQDIGTSISILHATHANAEYLYDNLRKDVLYDFNTTPTALIVTKHAASAKGEATQYAIPTSPTTTVAKSSISKPSTIPLYKTNNTIYIYTYTTTPPSTRQRQNTPP